MNFSQPSGAPTNVPPKQPFNAAQIRNDIVNYKPSAYSNEANLAILRAREAGGAYVQNEANLARAMRGFDGTGSSISSFYAGPTRMQKFGQFVKKHAAGAGVSAGIVGGVIGAAAGIKQLQELDLDTPSAKVAPKTDETVFDRGISEKNNEFSKPTTESSEKKVE